MLNYLGGLDIGGTVGGFRTVFMAELNMILLISWLPRRFRLRWNRIYLDSVGLSIYIQ